MKKRSDCMWSANVHSWAQGWCFPFFLAFQLSEEFRKMGTPNKQHSFHCRWANTSVCQQGTGPHSLLLSLYCTPLNTPTQWTIQLNNRCLTRIYTINKSVKFYDFGVQGSFHKSFFLPWVCQYISQEHVLELSALLSLLVESVCFTQGVIYEIQQKQSLIIGVAKVR